MIWNLMAMLISVTCAIFYKRHKIKNKHFVEIKGPAVICFNHPNAFMDSVSWVIFGGPPKYFFLARGDAFRNKIATFFFESLYIAPIYRMQDEGKEGLKKNDETYRRVNRLLKKNKKIVVYPEGLCIQERRLRPLKKGVPRMVFGAMEEMNDPDFVVIPVGINYSNPKKFRSTIFFNVGEPIKVSEYMAHYHEQPARTMTQFLHDLEPRMKQLMLHINDPKNDVLVYELEELLKPAMAKESGVNRRDLEQDYLLSKRIIQTVNDAEANRPEKMEELRLKSHAYFSELKQAKVRDWLIDPQNGAKLNWGHALLRVILLIAGWPLYFRALLGNYLPYKLSKKMADKIAKNVEFHASMNLGIGSFLFLFFYIIQFCIAYAIAPNAGWAWLVIVESLVTGLFALQYHPFKQKTAGLLRVLKNKTLLSHLRQKRAEIVAITNGLT